MSARLQSEIFDIGTELRGFGVGAGAVVAFSGQVRVEGGQVQTVKARHILPRRFARPATRTVYHR